MNLPAVKPYQSPIVGTVKLRNSKARGIEVASYNTSGFDPITLKTDAYRLSRKLNPIKKFLIRNPEAAEEVLRREGRPWRRFGTGHGDEILAAYASDGRLLEARQGEEKRVLLSVREAEDMTDNEKLAARKDQRNERAVKEKAGIMLHNHPGGWSEHWDSDLRQGTSFSRQDIEMAVNNEIRSNRLVPPGWTFRMLPHPDNGPWSQHFFDTKVRPAIYDITQKLIDSGHITDAPDFDHRVMLELAKRKLLIYTYEHSNAPWWQVKKRY